MATKKPASAGFFRLCGKPYPIFPVYLVFLRGAKPNGMLYDQCKALE